MLNSEHIIIPLPGNEKFAASLVNAGGWQMGQLQTRRFPDGETYLRLQSNVAGRCVNLVCTLADPDAGFLRLIFAADAARGCCQRKFACGWGERSSSLRA